MLLGIPGLLLAATCALALVFMTMGKLSPTLEVIFKVAVLAVLSAAFLWFGWPIRHGLSSRHYKLEMQKHAENLTLYNNLWACMDCGHIFLPTTLQKT